MGRQLQNNKGFSLISAMVASLLLAVGILALTRIFPQSAVINANADRVSMATNLAEDKIEELRALGYAVLRDTIIHGHTAGTDTVGQILRQYNLVLDTPYTGIVQVRVKCSWKNAGRVDSSVVELATFISSYE